MTEVTTCNDEEGLESISVTWIQDDEVAVGRSSGNIERSSLVRRQTMPNGDPPSAMLWGDEE
jgi:hypothetical protein